MKLGNITLAALLTLSVVILPLYSDTQEHDHKVFTDKETVKINTICGDVIIKVGKSNKVIVDVEHDVIPKNIFTYSFREIGKTLRIKEDWFTAQSNGPVTWTITVPARTNISVNSSTGDIEVTGLTGELDVSTASGNVELMNLNSKVTIEVASGTIDVSNISGNLDMTTFSSDINASHLSGTIILNTTSGSIDLKKSAGIFDINSAGGDIDASDITIEDGSFFASATGDINVSLTKAAEFNLLVSSASGNAVLEYNGNKMKGSFESVVQKSKGRIIFPFSFNSEKEFKQYGQIYIEKRFSAGSTSPLIKVNSISGNAVVRK